MDGAVVSDFLLKQTPLLKNSEEFSRIEYFLQLSLRSCAARVLNVWSIGNPHLTLQFEKKTQGLLALDSFVDVTKLDEDNGLHDLCQRGFRFEPRGMKFDVGTLDLHNLTPVSRGPNKKPRYEFLLTKIGVGRSYCVDEPSLASSKPTVPDGYHSLYLHKTDDQAMEEERQKLENTKLEEGMLASGSNQYRHEYLLVDPAQALPCFLIHFEFDPNTSNAVVEYCDVCEDAPASLYCSSDNAKLCDACDEEVHRQNKLVSRHIRVPLKEQPKPFGSCPQHEGQSVEFFCPQCHIPVCVHCKMVGNHSTGDAATHKLIGISEAYSSILAAAQKEDPHLDGRRQAIRSHLRQIDERLREVNKNSSTVEEQIYQILQEALFQLQDETQRKMSILLGEELELRRQMEQMDWMESFLRYQQDMLNPVEFLTSWNRHSQLRSDIVATQHLRPREQQVLADIKLDGRIKVSTENKQAGVNTSRVAEILGAQQNNQSNSNASLQNMQNQLSPSSTGPVGGPLEFSKPPSTTFRQSLFNRGGAAPSPTGMGMSVQFSGQGNSYNNLAMEDSYSRPGVQPPQSRFHDSAFNGPVVDRNSPAAQFHSQSRIDTVNDQSFEPPSTASSVRPHIQTANQSGVRRSPVSSPVVASKTNVNPSFSLREQSERRRRQLQATGTRTMTGSPFQESRIVDFNQAMTLYYCLPFTNEPETKLLFATWQHGTQMSTLHALCDSQGPTVVLVKVGGNVFGGYAGTPWNTNSTRFGTAKSFLFSLTHDAKIPYQGKHENSCCLWASPECISFGGKDLILRDDFSNCSSELEFSYGVGLGAEDARTFLAGSPIFVPDEVEVWAFSR